MQTLIKQLTRAVEVSSKSAVRVLLTDFIREYKSKTYNDDIKAVIKDINTVMGKRYRVTEKSSKMIVKWLKKGYTVEDFQKVHRYKWQEWKDSEQKKYLRPATLYAIDHFEDYLEASRNVKIKKDINYDEEEYKPAF